MSLTAKVMPYKQGMGPFAPEVFRLPFPYPYRWPTGPEHAAERSARLRDGRDAQAHRRGQHRRRHRGADPGRGRVHRPGARVPEGSRRLLPASTASCSSPMRSRAGWAAPAVGSRSRTRTSSRTCHERQVPRRRAADQRDHRSRGAHGQRARRRARRDVRREPGRRGRGARRARQDRARGPARALADDGRAPDRASSAISRRSTRSSATSAAAG